MNILPAIDLRGGRCVRLRQGRYDDETVFDEDPAAVARRFREAGAQWLHVVDLDGAREGRPVHRDVVRRIMEAAPGMDVEVGGGLRETEAVGEVLGLGVRRVVVGTRAIREPAWLRQVAKAWPGRVALGLDARGGRPAVEGWQQEAEGTVLEWVEGLGDLPLAAIIYTDILRDGMMSGPNFEATAALAAATRFPVIASGGVTTVEDVVRLRGAGVAGAIIGRALYEGTITVEAALTAAGETNKGRGGNDA